MALGATRRGVAGMLLAQALRPVGLGLVGGATLAGTVAMGLLATPAALEIGTVVQVFDPLAYAASSIVILAACVLATLVPAVPATRIDPIAALRRD